LLTLPPIGPDPEQKPFAVTALPAASSRSNAQLSSSLQRLLINMFVVFVGLRSWNSSSSVSVVVPVTFSKRTFVTIPAPAAGTVMVLVTDGLPTSGPAIGKPVAAYVVQVSLGVVRIVFVHSWMLPDRSEIGPPVQFAKHCANAVEPVTAEHDWAPPGQVMTSSSIDSAPWQRFSYAVELKAWSHAAVVL
jgi:hypothetical protein